MSPEEFQLGDPNTRRVSEQGSNRLGADIAHLPFFGFTKDLLRDGAPFSFLLAPIIGDRALEQLVYKGNGKMEDIYFLIAA